MVEARRLAETAVGMPCPRVLGQAVNVIQEGGAVVPWLGVMLRKVWPDIPSSVLGAAWATCFQQGHATPYNRGQRKRHDRTRGLVVNLVVGSTQRSVHRVCDEEPVVQVLGELKQEFEVPAAFGSLLQPAARGKIPAILAGPSSSTYTSGGGDGPPGPPSSRTRNRKLFSHLTWEQFQEVYRADEHMYRIFVVMLFAVTATPIDQKMLCNLVGNPEDPDHDVCSGVAAIEAPHGYPTLWETSIYKQAHVNLVDLHKPMEIKVHIDIREPSQPRGPPTDPFFKWPIERRDRSG